MAKPGSRGARAIANGAGVDLSRAKMTDQQAWELQEMVELKDGKRCNGCGRRIGIGFQFTSIGVTEQEPIIKLAACSRHDCEFAEDAKPGATFMEVVEFVWLDELGVEAPAAQAIVKRNERRAAAAAAREVEQ